MPDTTGGVWTVIRALQVLSLIAWSVGLCGPSAVFAQHGPGRHGPGSGQPPQAPTYDANTEVIVTGTVEDVKTGRSAFSKILQLHTMGLRHGAAHARRVMC